MVVVLVVEYGWGGSLWVVEKVGGGCRMRLVGWGRWLWLMWSL